MKKSYKELSIPYFKEAFTLIDSILTSSKINYYLIGANAVALNLLESGQRPSRGTKDIDFAIMISSMKQYDQVSSELCKNGFDQRSEISPCRFYHSKYNLAIDFLPFGIIEQENTVKFTNRKIDLHVLGFKEVHDFTISIDIEDKLINIPPLEAMVILKFISWSDRPENRENDLADILNIIHKYFDHNEEEIYANFNYLFEKYYKGGEFDQHLLSAEVLGNKASTIINTSEAIKTRITQILDENISSPETSPIGIDWSNKMDISIEDAIKILIAFKDGMINKM